MIGHTLGAAGALEAIVTVQAIIHNRLHPNINLDDPEDDIDTNVLVGDVYEPHKIRVRYLAFFFCLEKCEVLYTRYEYSLSPFIHIHVQAGLVVFLKKSYPT